jgi:hypothetical protein
MSRPRLATLRAWLAGLLGSSPAQPGRKRVPNRCRRFFTGLLRSLGAWAV